MIRENIAKRHHHSKTILIRDKKLIADICNEYFTTIATELIVKEKPDDYLNGI